MVLLRQRRIKALRQAVYQALRARAVLSLSYACRPGDPHLSTLPLLNRACALASGHVPHLLALQAPKLQLPAHSCL